MLFMANTLTDSTHHDYNIHVHVVCIFCEQMQNPKDPSLSLDKSCLLGTGRKYCNEGAVQVTFMGHVKNNI